MPYLVVVQALCLQCWAHQLMSSKLASCISPQRMAGVCCTRRQWTAWSRPYNMRASLLSTKASFLSGPGWRLGPWRFGWRMSRSGRRQEPLLFEEAVGLLTGCSYFLCLWPSLGREPTVVLFRMWALPREEPVEGLGLCWVCVYIVALILWQHQGDVAINYLIRLLSG